MFYYFINQLITAVVAGRFKSCASNEGNNPFYDTTKVVKRWISFPTFC